MFRFCFLLRVALIAAGLSPCATMAAGTAAGVDISNIASASFTDPWGTTLTVNSNAAVFRVAEVLDVTLVGNDAGSLAVVPATSDSLLSFTLTNTGNGSETFVLALDSTLTGDTFDPVNVRLYLDTNGDQLFDPTIDTLHVPGGNDPVLAADASLRLFVVADIPGGLVNGNTGLVRLGAEALTVRATPAADAPGTVFAGQGAGGGDAVVGSSQADDQRQGSYAVSLVATSFSKAATVLDPYGGSNPIPGATVTYSLTFAVTGSGDVTGAAIADAVPAGATYVPGSLALDGAALSDGSDSDSGRFTGSLVEVDLGLLSAPASHTVTFKVTIDN